MSTADETEQQRLRAIWEAHGAQAGAPTVLGMISTAKAHSPMHGTLADGGPVVGWLNCNVVMAAGCQMHRFFTRETVLEELNVQWMDDSVRNVLRNALLQVKTEHSDNQESANR
tara:strand:+ start:3629 stop:3970 length:342 start_codon:yes stop_codon:yes gene_type:complete